MSNTDEFNKEEEFIKDCKPLLDELVLHCSLHKIPFYWSACIKNNDKESIYISDAVATGSRNIKLTDNKINKHLSIDCGFDTIPNRDSLQINVDDIPIIDDFD